MILFCFTVKIRLCRSTGDVEFFFFILLLEMRDVNKLTSELQLWRREKTMLDTCQYKYVL